LKRSHRRNHLKTHVLEDEVEKKKRMIVNRRGLLIFPQACQRTSLVDSATTRRKEKEGGRLWFGL